MQKVANGRTRVSEVSSPKSVEPRFWVDLGEPSGSRPGPRRPFVVVQNDLFNRSRLATVVVCALTSNLLRAEAPGNVLVPRGEGNLSQDSVVNVTQLFTIDKSELADRVGRLGSERVAPLAVKGYWNGTATVRCSRKQERDGLARLELSNYHDQLANVARRFIRSVRRLR